MSSNMWNSTMNYLTKNRSGKMETKTITFTVSVAVNFDSEHQWQGRVRAIRSAIKDQIVKDTNMKILKVASKEE